MFAKTAVKIIGYLIYLIYILMTLRPTWTIILLPFIFLFFNINLKQRVVLLFVFAILDFEQQLIGFSFYGNWTNPKLHSLLLFQNYHSLGNSFYLYPLGLFISFGLVYYLAKILSFLRKINTAFILLFFFILIVLLIEVFNYFIRLPGAWSYLSVIIINGITRKVWLIFILSNELMYGKLSLLERLEGIFSPAISVRESLGVGDYKSKKSDTFWLGVGLSLLLIVLLFLFDQVRFQATGKIQGFFISNTFNYSLDCRAVNSPASIEDSKQLSPSFIWGCRLYHHVFIGIVKHILLDGLYFIIPLLLMGYKFNFPFNNFFKAKKYTTFLFGLFYYYGITIYRVFILEFYKLLLKIFKKRNRYLLPLATFLGVYLGGILWHMVEDYLFVFAISEKGILENLFSLNFHFYFFFMALFCSISELISFNFFPGKLRCFRVIFYIFILTTLRFVFSGYFNDVQISNKLFVLLRSFQF